MGEEGLGSTVMGNGVMVMGRGGKLTNVVLNDRLEPYTKVKVDHTNLLSSYRNLKFLYTNYIIS